ncbi:uncharacterized protein PHACADRAFT_185922 [Phanerochaete carnosa HHB-10118-sp]|uniref:Secreted protein n=1 Tax=Phanerochaete carnosa (strain HHB-10118-sp) TaxID=650164 RepID=K5VP17_PHACS|nr:uncharacterized protein PHACADRAFT_185922 [Phanerochaete carnosa HHB-10118-sp]EKM53218.1 hypothetical protein PHACADRAFT_185922 [Phanerochaete carnosa HHB-10118-sp]
MAGSQRDVLLLLLLAAQLLAHYCLLSNPKFHGQTKKFKTFSMVTYTVRSRCYRTRGQVHTLTQLLFNMRYNMVCQCVARQNAHKNRPLVLSSHFSVPSRRRWTPPHYNTLSPELRKEAECAAGLAARGW